MITEDYVSFEIAKLLKEKGFDEITFTWYTGKGRFCVGKNNFDDYHMNHFSNMAVARDKNKCSAPTLQMAMKWLREEKDIQIEIAIVGTDTWESPTKWMYGFRCQTKDVIDRRNADFSSYEQACEIAIKYCLENLI